MKRSIILILFVQSFFACHLSAQYSFVLDSAVYQPLPGIISLNGNETWDDPEFSIPLDFTFGYYGKPISIIDFTLGLGAIITSLEQSGTQFPIMVPFNADLIDRGADPLNVPGPGSQSTIGYQRSGSVGNRIFKLEWRNVGFYEEKDLLDTAISFVNFQFWIYENGKLEVRFGENNIVNPDIVFEGDTGPSIAMYEYFDIQSNEVGPGIVLFGDSNHPEFENQISDLVSLNNMPRKNLIYRFAPITIKTNEHAILNDIRLLKNPTTDYLMLTGSDLYEVNKLQILDCTGKILSTHTNGNEYIDISQLASGKYFIQLISSKGVRNISFLKQ